MRFRAKFGLLDAAYIVLPLFMLVLLLSGPRHASPFLRDLMIISVLFGLGRVSSQTFVYWDVTLAGLHERRFWSSRMVPWQQIESIIPWPDGKPMQGSVAIDFGSSAPLSSTGRVIANPDRLNEFLAELREHAPQARFAVPVTGSILPVSEIR